MERKDSLWHVFGYLDQSDLGRVKGGTGYAVCKDWRDRVEAVGIWRELFTSVADSTRKYLSSLQNTQKQLRIRTIRPYRPAKMPEMPGVKGQVEEEKKEEPGGHSKQWFGIPENIVERLNKTTINKVAVLKKDAAFVDALALLMSTWTDTIQKTVLQVTQAPMPATPLEHIAYWKDSERILLSLLTELNDVNIAKVDFILAGSSVHARYLKELAGLKQACNQSKALALHLSPLEKHIRKLGTFSGITLVLSSLLSSLEAVQSCCAYLTRERALELMGKISRWYVEDKVMETLGKEVTVQRIAQSERENAREIITKVKAIFECFLRSSFLEGEKRGITAAPGPRSFSFRPASARLRTVPTDIALRKLFTGCLAVCQDLYTAVDLFQQLKELTEDPVVGEAAEETLHIYTDSKEVFDLFSPENTLQWDSLLQSLQERLITVKRGPLPQVEIEEMEGDSEEELDESLVKTQWKVI